MAPTPVRDPYVKRPAFLFLSGVRGMCEIPRPPGTPLDCRGLISHSCKTNNYENHLKLLTELPPKLSDTRMAHCYKRQPSEKNLGLQLTSLHTATHSAGVNRASHDNFHHHLLLTAVICCHAVRTHPSPGFPVALFGRRSHPGAKAA